MLNTDIECQRTRTLSHLPIEILEEVNVESSQLDRKPGVIQEWIEQLKSIDVIRRVPMLRIVFSF